MRIIAAHNVGVLRIFNDISDPYRADLAVLRIFQSTLVLSLIVQLVARHYHILVFVIVNVQVYHHIASSVKHSSKTKPFLAEKHSSILVTLPAYPVLFRLSRCFLAGLAFFIQGLDTIYTSSNRVSRVC
jgi:hypothetical protein